MNYINMFIYLFIINLFICSLIHLFITLQVSFNTRLPFPSFLFFIWYLPALVLWGLEIFLNYVRRILNSLFPIPLGAYFIKLLFSQYILIFNFCLFWSKIAGSGPQSLPPHFNMGWSNIVAWSCQKSASALTGIETFLRKNASWKSSLQSIKIKRNHKSVVSLYLSVSI